MTDRIYISDYFNDNAKNIITEALKKTQLPEGVHVVGWNETEKAEKPFIVLVYSAKPEDARKAFRDGALDYAQMHVNPDHIAEELNR